jgi:hypothetical protein
MSQKLKENITKEIESIAEKGLSAGNLPTAKMLLEMKKELIEIEEKEQGGVMGMPRHRENYREYRDDDEYARRRSYRDNYERSGSGGGGRGYGGYGGYDIRMRDHMDRIMDGAESYEYGRDRYMHGGDEARLQDGIEKLMYALCMFIESTMEFAETPQEKETIRRHLQKLNKL